MKSVKQGRGPSMFSGFAAIVIGIIMMLMSGFMDSFTGNGMFGNSFEGDGMFDVPSIFRIAPILMGLVAIGGGLYSLYTAFAKNRPSVIDITDDGEEEDPLNTRFGSQGMYCPACGKKAKDNFQFCPHCGKPLPGSGEEDE